MKYETDNKKQTKAYKKFTNDFLMLQKKCNRENAKQDPLPHPPPCTIQHHNQKDPKLKS